MLCLWRVAEMNPCGASYSNRKGASRLSKKHRPPKTVMKNFSAKLALLVITLTMAVPESYAKRMGSGRSSGRQTNITKQRTLPPSTARTQPAPPAVPAAPVRPQGDLARQLPPARPAQPPRQASSPWGGMLGGALLGLGLGSLMSSSGDRNANAANQNSGASGDGTAASGNETAQGEQANQANQTQATRQESENRSGSLLLPIVLALGAFFVIRRLMARARRRNY